LIAIAIVILIILIKFGSDLIQWEHVDISFEKCNPPGHLDGCTQEVKDEVLKQSWGKDWKGN